VCLERETRALEKNDATGVVVGQGVPIVGVVQFSEVCGHADRVAAGFDIGEHPRVPHTLFTFTVGAVVIQVGKLTDQSAFADAGTADDCDSHVGG
jgi:hypothetical protein